MAHIAEELLLLLLDNASAQPALERARLDRVLPAAILLDLAYACRIRPALPTEPVGPGSLVVLMGPDPVSPVVLPALTLLARKPVTPAAAIAKLRRNTFAEMLEHLEHTGQIRSVELQRKRFRKPPAWPLTDRGRATRVRGAMMAALFDGKTPAASTAAIISLLHAVDGLGALLSLNDRGWYWVNSRAGEIASGSWVQEYDAGLPDINLAVTLTAVRAALQ